MSMRRRQRQHQRRRLPVGRWTPAQQHTTNQQRRRQPQGWVSAG